ncbi:hypothetical protein [Tolypothrix sp. PCC 7910]|uniref:hypothetical protein n=1 Tax=Tolypothrix sp. PCC 7910 TaxID=2099387 RepID=UPI001FCA9764|nr:hypothetical protein [Tolypothrix sp. PCC 7910]
MVVRILISERDQVGGTCVMHVRIPEKLMAYTASFSHFFEDADEYGWNIIVYGFINSSLAKNGNCKTYF